MIPSTRHPVHDNFSLNNRNIQRMGALQEWDLHLPMRLSHLPALYVTFLSLYLDFIILSSGNPFQLWLSSTTSIIAIYKAGVSNLRYIGHFDIPFKKGHFNHRPSFYVNLPWTSKTRYFKGSITFITTSPYFFLFLLLNNNRLNKK